MSKIAFTFLLLPFLLYGCFVADAIFLDSDHDQETLQERSEKAVYDYLLAEFKDEYIPYGYSEITVYKPRLIVVRDSLIKAYNKAPSDTLENRINTLNDSIIKNNIERSVSLSHFYLVDQDTNTFEVMEGVFTLSDTLTVKSYKPTIYKKLEDSKRTILYDFFYEQSIFIAQSFSESSRLSKNFYAFFKSKMEGYSLMTLKSDFLEHSLQITEIAKKIGDYKPHEIAKALISNNMKLKYGINNYNPIKWSQLNEVSSEEQGLQGYYFFHKFTILDSAVDDTVVKLFEFNPYLEVMSETIMDKPYNQYFE